LGLRGGVVASPRLVELVPKPSAAASPGVRIRVRDLVVELDADFGAPTLQCVLAVVGAAR
jgi:hypothetical protein